MSKWVQGADAWRGGSCRSWEGLGFGCSDGGRKPPEDLQHERNIIQLILKSISGHHVRKSLYEAGVKVTHWEAVSHDCGQTE